MNNANFSTIGAAPVAFFCFSSGTFYCDGDAPISQAQATAVWSNLPMTGSAWILGGEFFVTERSGATVHNLGPVSSDVVRCRL